MAQDERVTIGKASQASGVSAKMIRYYESIGLLSPAARSHAGYRTYDAETIHSLRFIRRARDLGFSVDEISELLMLWKDRSRRSADVQAIARRHIDDLERRVRQFQDMIDTLSTLVHACHGDERPHCPILTGLEQPQEAPSERAELPRFGAGVRHASSSQGE